MRDIALVMVCAVTAAACHPPAPSGSAEIEACLAMPVEPEQGRQPPVRRATFDDCIKERFAKKPDLGEMVGELTDAGFDCGASSPGRPRVTCRLSRDKAPFLIENWEVRVLDREVTTYHYLHGL